MRGDYIEGGSVVNDWKATIAGASAGGAAPSSLFDPYRTDLLRLDPAYVKYHNMTCREDLRDGERKIETFLTHLAVEGNVAPSAQNQAMNASVFLYKQVLKKPVDPEINAVRARRKERVGHKDVSTTMIYTHVLQQGGSGVASPLDHLGS